MRTKDFTYIKIIGRYKNRYKYIFTIFFHMILIIILYIENNRNTY